tara:strand:- start:55 stop:894 length:840 start_codon:yes stop_codon:yes gene_type:complete
MILLEKYSQQIEDFVIRTLADFKEKEGEPSSMGIYCCPSSGWISLNFNIKKTVKETEHNCPDFEYVEFGLIDFEDWTNEYDSKHASWQDETGFVFKYDDELGDEGINNFFFIYLKSLYWAISKKHRLPDTLIQMLDSKHYTFIQETSLDRLGKFIIHQMRDEAILLYESHKQNAKTKSLNSNQTKEFLDLEKERQKLIRGLKKSEIAALDKLILNIVDNAAFTLLRGIQESMDDCDGTENVELKIDGKKANELDLTSGSLFGDYFDWIQRFSRYGEFQH